MHSDTQAAYNANRLGVDCLPATALHSQQALESRMVLSFGVWMQAVAADLLPACGKGKVVWVGGDCQDAELKEGDGLQCACKVASRGPQAAVAHVKIPAANSQPSCLRV